MQKLIKMVEIKSVTINFLRVVTAVVCFNCLAPVGFLFAESGPPVSLDSKMPHLMIWGGSWVPEIKFYGNSELKGPPIFQLNAEGLHQEKRLLCSWPGGRFNSDKSYNMVLGYSDVDAGSYLGCGEGGPILSTWGDGGTGTAVLYVRVIKKNGSIITTSHLGKNYYLDLNIIPKKNWKWLEAGNDFISPGE